MIDWKRYRQLGLFFAKAFLQLIWWDVILNQPLLRWFRSPPLPRWQQLAREYRTLAIEMGGVLVKLGQFMSLRVDILPRDVARELAGLQDQMPYKPREVIIAQIESDLGRPIGELFASFAPQPVASASVAQVHLAQLHSGEQVVVKVLRPGVEVQFETDLAAITLLMRSLNYIKRLRQNVDLDQLAAEFSTVTRRELDLEAEGKNAERLAKDFEHEPYVYIPKIYWAYSGTQTLTLENVGYIKIGKLEAIDATGINRQEVARKLAQIYLRQIFVTHFFHADPHPGNLFIKPLPHPDEKVNGFAVGEVVPYKPGRPFQIVLIDFGMSVEIPARAQTWLREFVIGYGLRDAHRITQSYVMGGILRPGANLERIEEMTEALLENWGELLMGQMLNREQTRRFSAEYQDFIYDSPFQIQADLLFMYRAIGLMSSMVKKLEPDFDIWTAITPFAKQLLWQEWQKNIAERLEALTKFGQLLLTYPLPIDQLLLQAPDLFKVPDYLNQLVKPPWSDLTIQSELTAKDRQAMQQLEKSVNRLSGIMVAVSLLITSVVWHVGRLIAGAMETPNGNQK